MASTQDFATTGSIAPARFSPLGPKHEGKNLGRPGAGHLAFNRLVYSLGPERLILLFTI